MDEKKQLTHDSLEKWKQQYDRALRPVDYTERNQTHLYRFLRERGYLFQNRQTRKRKRDEVEPTLRMTDWVGACVQFPYVEWPNVHRAMSRDLDQKSSHMYWNEFSYESEGVRLFLELDFREMHARTLESLRPSLKAIHQLCQKYFPEGNLEMAIMTCNPKPKTIKIKNENGDVIREELRVSSGFHLIFYNKIVTIQQALQVIHSAEILLERKPYDLHNVVDTAPYKIKKGYATLRPEGCHKKVPCNVCNDLEEVRPGCPRCRSRGKLQEASTYFLLDVWNSHGIPDSFLKSRMQDDSFFRLQRCSIVAMPNQVLNQDFVIPMYEPRFIPKASRSRAHHAKGKNFVYQKDKRRSRGKSETVTDPKVLAMVEKCIEAIHDAYQGTTLGTVQRNSNSYFVDLKGRGRSYCRVLGREHTSNRVYFMFNLKKQQILMYCYDEQCKQRIKENRVFHESLSIPLTSYQLNILFPEQDIHNNEFLEYLCPFEDSKTARRERHKRNLQWIQSW